MYIQSLSHSLSLSLMHTLILPFVRTILLFSLLLIHILCLSLYIFYHLYILCNWCSLECFSYVCECHKLSILNHLIHTMICLSNLTYLLTYPSHHIRYKGHFTHEPRPWSPNCESPKESVQRLSEYTFKIMYCGHKSSSVMWSHMWPGPQPNAITMNFYLCKSSHMIK